jgi:cell division protein FtsI (penicillin-binding protein 3)
MKLLSEMPGDKPESIAMRYGGPVSDGQQFRGRVVLTIIMLGLLVVCGRLVQLHLNPDLELSDEERKHIGKKVLEHPRGEIYDRNGLVLATNHDVPSLWCDPRKVKNPDDLAEKISAALGMDLDQAFAKLTATESSGRPMKFVWVKRWLNDVPEPVLDDLLMEGGGALDIKYESARFYPQGETASHLLGFVNRVGDAQEGVEKKFDPFLKSVPGELLARKDGARQLLESLTLEYKPPEGGDSIQLTLDTTIQHSLESALDKRIIECNAARGMGIVMDPHSGAILAMACRPAFDPNHYTEYPPELRKNRALVDVFEPGSAFKIVVAAGALEQRIVTPQTMINCENGGFNPYGHYIKDFHRLGVEPFKICFQESSNVAMIKLAAQMGPENFDQWVRRFGFGSTTSRDFTQIVQGKLKSLESAGLYRPREKWTRLSMGSLPMGQEIAVTMPQLARAYCVIANGGYLVEPYFVERAVNRHGETTYQFPHAQPQRIISAETAATMRDLCKNVVENGTGEKADIPEYTSAGKTGTAQMARTNGKGYDPDRFTTIFAGFAPADNPAVVCIIVIQEPMIRLHYGGYVCGPVFKEVVREALVRLDVPPDRPENAPRKNKESKEPKRGPAEDADTIVARLDEDAQAMLEDELENLLEPLDGLQLVAPVPTLVSGEPVKRLPDFTGMNKRQAGEELRSLGVPWDVKGSGWVVSQYPPPGTPIYEVMQCSLQFERRVSPIEPLTEEEKKPLKQEPRYPKLPSAEAAPAPSARATTKTKAENALEPV